MRDFVVRTACLGLLCVLVSCGENSPAPSPEATEERGKPLSSPSAAPDPKRSPDRPSTVVGGDIPAAVLKRYYALVAAGDYAEAFRMREPGRHAVTLARFASSFANYRDHRATIGAPSDVAEANGWLYVEVPVHIYGTLESGQPFSTAGTVTMRRRASGADGDWRIYTGG